MVRADGGTERLKPREVLRPVKPLTEHVLARVAQRGRSGFHDGHGAEHGKQQPEHQLREVMIEFRDLEDQHALVPEHFECD